MGGIEKFKQKLDDKPFESVFHSEEWINHFTKRFAEDGGLEKDFVSEKKTLQGMCTYITNQARKKATNSHYLCTDIKELFEWAEDYIRAEEPEPKPEPKVKPKANAPKLKLKENDDGQMSLF